MRLFGGPPGRPYLFRLAATIGTVSMLPLAVLSVASQREMRAALEEMVVSDSKAYLGQTVKAVEMVFSSVENAILAVTIDAVVRDATKKDATAAYDPGRDSYSAFLQSMWQRRWVFERLSQLALSNEFVVAAYLLGRGSMTVFTSDATTFSYGEFPQASRLAAILADHATQGSHYERARLTMGRSRSLLSAIYLDRDMLLVVDMDLGRIHGEILRHVEMRSALLALVTRDGEVYHSEHPRFPSDLTRPVLRSATETESVNVLVESVGDIQALIVSRYSSFLGLWIASFTSLEQIYAGMRATLLRGLIVSVVSLVITLTATCFLIRFLYQPIRVLLDKARRLRPEVASGGELDVVDRTLSRLMSDSALLKRRLQESMPALRERILYSLIQGRLGNPDAAEAALAQAGIRLRPEKLAVVVVRLKTDAEHKQHYTDQSMAAVKVKSVFEATLEQLGNGCVLETVEDEFVLIVNEELPSLQSVFDLASLARSAVRKSTDCGCAVGISRLHRGLLDLPAAYSEASEAVASTILNDSSEIVHIEDIRLSSARVFAYPQNREDALLDCLRAGLVEQAQAALELFFDCLNPAGDELSSSQIRHVVLRLASSVIKTVNDLGFVMEEILSHDAHDPYLTLIRKSDLEEMEDQLRSMVNRASQHVAAAIERKRNTLVDRVKDRIARDCGLSTNLKAIAAELMVNPDYISRAFREARHTRFQNYLTEVRIAKSKKLLEHSPLPLSGICREVGYSNSNYFIRVFREHTGMTPNEFRRVRRRACERKSFEGAEANEAALS